MQSREENVKRLAEKIKQMKVGMMTTMDPDSSLRSRPMAVQQLEFDGDLWFFTKRDSGKVHAIENDQHVNVAFANPDDQKYVSIAGRASIVMDHEKMAQLWTPMMKAWFPEGLEDPEIALLCVEVDSAEIWDSPSSSVVQILGLAKAVVTGQSYDEGRRPDRVEL